MKTFYMKIRDVDSFYFPSKSVQQDRCSEGNCVSSILDFTLGRNSRQGALAHNGQAQTSRPGELNRNVLHQAVDTVMRRVGSRSRENGTGRRRSQLQIINHVESYTTYVRFQIHSNCMWNHYLASSFNFLVLHIRQSGPSLHKRSTGVGLQCTSLHGKTFSRKMRSIFRF